jgi:hypothetical protein
VTRKYYQVGKIDVFRGPDVEHQYIFEAWMKQYPEIERIYNEDHERVVIGYESPSMTVSVAFTEKEFLMHSLKYNYPKPSWFMAE